MSRPKSGKIRDICLLESCVEQVHIGCADLEPAMCESVVHKIPSFRDTLRMLTAMRRDGDSIWVI